MAVNKHKKLVREKTWAIVFRIGNHAIHATYKKKSVYRA